MLNHRRAFTLIELLVVIAIIAILAAILFPVFAQAKAAAKKTSSLSNVKQITLAQFLYKDDFDETVAMNRTCNIFLSPSGPGGQIPCQVGRALLGWIDLTVPYVKNYGIFKSPADGIAPIPLPAGATYADSLGGGPATVGLMFGPRPANNGGDFRSSYARNNNFANNGNYTVTDSQVQFPSSTILIHNWAANSGAGASGNEGVPGSTFSISRRSTIFPAPGTCTGYNPLDTGNNRSNAITLLNNPNYLAAYNADLALPSSERYNGVGIYGFVDGHAKAIRPDAVRGQCGFGDRSRGPADTGNDGTVADFRL